MKSAPLVGYQYLKGGINKLAFLLNYFSSKSSIVQISTTFCMYINIFQIKQNQNIFSAKIGKMSYDLRQPVCDSTYNYLYFLRQSTLASYPDVSIVDRTIKDVCQSTKDKKASKKMSKCNIDGESVYQACDVTPFKDMFGTLLWN